MFAEKRDVINHVAVVIKNFLECVIIQSLNMVANNVWENRMNIEHVILDPVHNSPSPIDQNTHGSFALGGVNALMAFNIKSLIA